MHIPHACHEQLLSIADDAQQELSQVLPALEAAQKALDALNKNDIIEIKTFTKPPALVQLTMEGVCVLLQVNFPANVWMLDIYVCTCIYVDFMLGSALVIKVLLLVTMAQSHGLPVFALPEPTKAVKSCRESV